ncbi:hypothetical protein [Streptomyces sp. NPDC127103]|uniref:hypothetical protein n=1 Tax=Streptomyces sp. NPDC127103 TaxID=3347139 RepID=UPI003653F0D0
MRLLDPDPDPDADAVLGQVRALLRGAVTQVQILCTMSASLSLGVRAAVFAFCHSVLPVAGVPRLGTAPVEGATVHGALWAGVLAARENARAGRWRPGGVK